MSSAPAERGSSTDAARSLGRRVLVTVGIVAAVTVLLLFTWHARDVLLLAFAGLLFGIFLRRLATLVADRTPLGPRVALAAVTLALVGALAGAFWAQGPAIAEQVRELREALPQAVERLEARLERYDWGERAVEAMPSPGELLPDDPDAVGRVTGVVSRTFSALTSAVIILFLGLVLAATPGVYVRGLVALVPRRAEARAREVIDRAYDTLWWWLVGRVISMTFIGVVTGIGLAVLGVPLAFVLALLAALLSFIPNLGPILSAAPAILLALVDGPRQALWVAALYAGVQVIESYVLDPIIDRKTVYLPPAVTIFAQLVLALFGGLLGVALATPLSALLMVLVTMLYVQDVLGKRDVQLESH